MVAMATDWDKDENGQIIIHPVEGWEIGVAFGSTVALRLRCSRQMAGGETDEVNLQLALSPQGASQLAEELLRAAQKLSVRPAGPAN